MVRTTAFLIALVLLFAAAGTAEAQTGSITGVVNDTTGAWCPVRRSP
jgi:hypothetical protein